MPLQGFMEYDKGTHSSRSPDHGTCKSNTGSSPWKRNGRTSRLPDQDLIDGLQTNGWSMEWHEPVHHWPEIRDGLLPRSLDHDTK
jgi:hypothetical protein